MSIKEKMLHNTDFHQDDSSFEPYIGPRPFRRDKKDQFRFFGRDAETEEIVSLIISHRLVLVYAQSGAGKTSIFNAQIIHVLEDHGFEVLPMARVQVTSVADISTKNDNDKVSSQIKNLYIYNALQSLSPEIGPQFLLNSSLFEFLDDNFPTHKDENGEIIQQVLIFDQLEELFRLYPDNWKDQQKDFFDQVADSLDNNPTLRIVLIIREDFLAQLDPFKNSLPEKLRPHFRLTPLHKEQAVLAIKGPLTNRLTPLHKEQAVLAIKGPLTNIIDNFTEDQAQEIEHEINELVDDLLKIYIENPNFGLKQIEGEFVEPIQLQVVCRRWWHERESSKTLGTKRATLGELANVDTALEDFYEDAILSASRQTGVHEREIRNWFEDKLITSSGTRSIIHKGRVSTGGIDNKVVEILESKYLIRREQRSGASWYELTHDRLISPIRNSNKTWRVIHEKKFKKYLPLKIIVPVVVAIVIVSASIAYYYGTQSASPIAPKSASPISVPLIGGGNPLVVAGATVTLNGSGSMDPDGSITSYQWSQIRSGGDPTVILATPNAESTTFTVPQDTPARYTSLTFKLTVTDDSGLSGSNVVNLVVGPKHVATCAGLTGAFLADCKK